MSQIDIAFNYNIGQFVLILNKQSEIDYCEREFCYLYCTFVRRRQHNIQVWRPVDDNNNMILLCKYNVSDNVFILYTINENSQVLYFIIPSHHHVTRLRLPHCVISIL